MEMDIRDGVLLGISGAEEHITLPEGIVSLGPFCFGSDPSLRSVRLPGSLGSIGKDSFYGCQSLEKVYIPPAAVSIEENAFARCTALREIVIPAGIRSIGTNAFAWCAALERVVFSEGLEEIGDYSFYSCSSLREALFPESLKSIGAGAFESCSLMRRVVFPSRLESLGRSSFSFCRTIRRLDLPDGTRVLPESTFAWCVALREVAFPPALEEIGDYCFFNCSALESVDLPGSLSSLGTECFSTCALKKVMIPPGLLRSGDGAFYHNPGIILTLHAGCLFDPMHLACIDCPSDGPDTKGATIYLEHTLQLYDPSDESLAVLPVYNDASSVYRYRVITGSGKGYTGDVTVLDDALEDAISSSTFIKTALFRLRQAEELPPELRERYTRTVRENSSGVMEEALGTGDLDAVMLLGELEVLSPEDMDVYIERASRSGHTDICAYLMEEKNRRSIREDSVMEELAL